MTDRPSALLEGYSQALYATWLWCKPYRVLFDCGEGVGPSLQNSVFAIRQVFLSHGHIDHLAGLPLLLNLRNAAFGNTDTPLSIYYPSDDIQVGWLRSYLNLSAGGYEYDLSWHEVRPGDRIAVDATRAVEPFATDHIKQRLTLGYRLVERRQRLKPDFRGLAGDQIRDLVRTHGRDFVNEDYDHRLLVYGGDGMPPEPGELAGADVVCLDCTFLNEADRGRPVHGVLDEMMAVAAEAGVGELVVMHVSGRYRVAETRAAIRAAAKATGFAGIVSLLWRGRLQPVVGDEGKRD